jgi:hypothetical protein
VNRPKSAFVALLLTIVAAVPAGAEQAPATAQPVADEFCSGCFAYLEFSPALEPESYAMRGQANETPTSLPAAAEANKRLEEQTAGLLVSSKR